MATRRGSGASLLYFGWYAEDPRACQHHRVWRPTSDCLLLALWQAYRDIEGSWAFPDFTLFVDHCQADPFAAPSRMRVQVRCLKVNGVRSAEATALHSVSAESTSNATQLSAPLRRNVTRAGPAVCGPLPAELVAVARPLRGAVPLFFQAVSPAFSLLSSHTIPQKNTQILVRVRTGAGALRLPHAAARRRAEARGGGHPAGRRRARRTPQSCCLGGAVRLIRVIGCVGFCCS